MDGEVGMQGALGGKLIKGKNRPMKERGQIVDLDLNTPGIVKSAKRAIKRIVNKR